MSSNDIAPGSVHIDWARFQMCRFTPTPESFSALLDRLDIHPTGMYISPVEMKRLLLVACIETNDEYYGHAETRAPIGTTEMALRVAFTADTIGEALVLTKRFYKIFDLGRHYDLRVNKDTLTLTITAPGLTDDDSGAIELCHLTTLIFGLSSICGQYLKANRLFTRSKLYADLMPFNRDLNAPIVYAQRTEAEFSSDILDLPVFRRQSFSPTSDALRWSILIEKLNIEGKMDPGRLLSGEELLAASNDIASLRNVDERQRRRIFQALNGDTARTLTNSVKLTKAMIMLSLSQRTNEEIASELEFTDERSFRRFFKNELGMAPSEYRQKMKETSSDKAVDLYKTLMSLVAKLSVDPQ